MSKNELKPSVAGRGITHRQPTPEELAQHEKDKPRILKEIRQNHAKTMQKVKRMQSGILYVDRGA